MSPTHQIYCLVWHGHDESPRCCKATFQNTLCVIHNQKHKSDKQSTVLNLVCQWNKDFRDKMYNLFSNLSCSGVNQISVYRPDYNLLLYWQHTSGDVLWHNSWTVTRVLLLRAINWFIKITMCALKSGNWTNQEIAPMPDTFCTTLEITRGWKMDQMSCVILAIATSLRGSRMVNEGTHAVVLSYCVTPCWWQWKC